MNQYPFNSPEPQDPNNLNNITHTQPPTDRELDPKTTQGKKVKKAEKRLTSLTLTLIAIGVTLGLAFAIGAVTILNQFNLFDSPARVDKVSE